MSTTPAGAGYHQPAEWDPHAATWLAWPFDADLWREDLEAAQAEWLALVRAISWTPPGAEPEHLRVAIPHTRHRAAVEAALEGLPATVHVVPYGDIWFRDIAPIYLVDSAGSVASVAFRFNGWGGKYVLEGDDLTARTIQEVDGGLGFASEAVLEGGSVDVDGEGTVLTTRQCLLNPNRGGVSVEEAEATLRETLGVERVLWLDDGLLHDHTDGHIDTIARFVRPGVVVCMAPTGPDDPNAAVLEAIAADLAGMTDARGRRLQVERVPSPGRVVDDDGAVMPASHVNFYIGNHTVVVPVYGTPHDDAAVRAIGRLFPDRRTVGCSARAVLLGGGAFHCITQQVPRGGKP